MYTGNRLGDVAELTMVDEGLEGHLNRANQSAVVGKMGLGRRRDPQAPAPRGASLKPTKSGRGRMLTLM